MLQEELNKTYSKLQEQHKKWHKELQDIILTMNEYFVSYIREDNNNICRNTKTSFGEISLEPNLISSTISPKYILLLLFIIIKY